MNPFRQELAFRAFQLLDKNRDGFIDLSDIKRTYNAKQHPDVKSGKKTEDEALFEFLDTFEQHHSDSVDDLLDHRVSKNEWAEYYNHVSMSIDRDDYFEAMMNSAWNFKNDRVTAKGYAGKF